MGYLAGATVKDPEFTRLGTASGQRPTVRTKLDLTDSTAWQLNRQ